jgi:pentatricopeptide repeat protein
MKLFWPKMSNKNIFPNVVIYNVLIDGFSKGDKLDEAVELFHEMDNNNIFPDVFTYSVLIEDFYKEGKLEGDMNLFHEIPNGKFCLGKGSQHQG